jgi:hypothetical protein
MHFWRSLASWVISQWHRVTYFLVISGQIRGDFIPPCFATATRKNEGDQKRSRGRKENDHQDSTVLVRSDRIAIFTRVRT